MSRCGRVMAWQRGNLGDWNYQGCRVSLAAVVSFIAWYAPSHALHLTPDARELSRRRHRSADRVNEDEGGGGGGYDRQNPFAQKGTWYVKGAVMAGVRCRAEQCRITRRQSVPIHQL